MDCSIEIYIALRKNGYSEENALSEAKILSKLSSYDFENLETAKILKNAFLELQEKIQKVIKENKGDQNGT